MHNCAIINVMKILIAENTRSVSASLSSRLIDYGHDVDLAEDGRLAIEKFMKGRYDLILMAINMPVMNGFESTRAIREYEKTLKWSWTPILFLIDSDSDENLMAAVDSGGDDLLPKGVSDGVLRARMRAMERVSSLRSELTKANGHLEEMSYTDQLTGLPNRRKLDMVVDAEWGKAESLKETFGIIMIDVDNFKKFNDAYGHQDGDECLRAVGQCIGRAVNNSNGAGNTVGAMAARYGGEEFSIMVPSATEISMSRLAAAVRTYLKELAIEHHGNDGHGIVTVSMGGAIVDPASGRIAHAFRVADKNLYAAKDAGRNSVMMSTVAPDRDKQPSSGNGI